MEQRMRYAFTTSKGTIEVTGPKVEELTTDELYEVSEFLKLVIGRMERLAAKRELQPGEPPT